ncbi:hypothetical protein NM208_g13700 [Fusarium decemcellulare]|uniref:Uncharacterized protein n=1 Tax=Fusarium decemcellulare TaxID=57161 RepID=A0ACC1RIW2_9HYPO|nr:hypothetical protein NM208_g13700 [Fusarium decemcellulare]
MNTGLINSRFLSKPDEVGVVAVGFSGGQPKAGVDDGPSVLIESGLLTQIKEELGYKLFGDETVQQFQDLIPESDPDYRGMKKPLHASAVTRKIAAQTYEHSRTRERLNREIAVIWVDAHADINTPEISDSGNIHGMPVAFLTGLATDDKEEYFGWVKEDMRLSVKKLVYIGLRSVDVGEKKILREHGIKAFSMHDVDRYVVDYSNM